MGDKRAYSAGGLVGAAMLFIRRHGLQRGATPIGKAERRWGKRRGASDEGCLCGDLMHAAFLWQTNIRYSLDQYVLCLCELSSVVLKIAGVHMHMYIEF